MEKYIRLIGIAALTTFFGTTVNAAMFSASFLGDVCSIPPGNPTGTDGDCSLIEQTATSPAGVFELMLGSLNPNIVGDAKITLSASSADMFQSDEQIVANGGGRNNLDEYFGLKFDSLSLGTLFDNDTADENAVSPSLAAAVEAAIVAATNSSSPISLIFTLSNAQIKPLLADGKLSAIFDFRSSDPSYNVNSFGDPMVKIEYETSGPSAVPVPAALPLLVAGLGGLGYIGRRKKKAA